MFRVAAMPCGPTPPLLLSARVVFATSSRWIRFWRAVEVSMVGPITLRVIWTAAAAHQVFSTSVLNTTFGRGSMLRFTARRTGVTTGARDGVGEGAALGKGASLGGAGSMDGAGAVDAEATAAARPAFASDSLGGGDFV